MAPATQFTNLSSLFEAAAKVTEAKGRRQSKVVEDADTNLDKLVHRTSAVGADQDAPVRGCGQLFVAGCVLGPECRSAIAETPAKTSAEDGQITQRRATAERSIAEAKRRQARLVEELESPDMDSSDPDASSASARGSGMVSLPSPSRCDRQKRRSRLRGFDKQKYVRTPS